MCTIIQHRTALETNQVVEVELVLVRDLEGAEVTLFGFRVLHLHVSLQVLLKLSARVADAANGFHDGLGLSPPPWLPRPALVHVFAQHVAFQLLRRRAAFLADAAHYLWPGWVRIHQAHAGVPGCARLATC